MRLAEFFKPNHERYDGVRPVNIFLLRPLFLLVVLFVGYDSWSYILTHEGPWDHVRAAAVCMWAAYSLLSLIGIFHPLKMLPIVLFEILYKLVWLVIVAYPLWSTNQLAGSPAEEMTNAFLWVVLPIIAMPWKYALDRYVLNRKPHGVSDRGAGDVSSDHAGGVPAGAEASRIAPTQALRYE